ncbi:MAG: hypothetical protein KAX13_01810, partial [Candidatus Krumholzibacteria bacterium]|nr:hypothetical protein [Candidatus Krumholzibacteria bacterium]
VLLYLEGTSFQAGQSLGVDIEAYDEYDNLLLTDSSTELVPVAEQPSMTFAPDTVTLSTGSASFTAADTQMGQNRIAILSLGGDTLSAWSPYITIDHADAYKILYVAGDTTGVIAGDRTELKARVRDLYDNNVNGEIVRFQITSNLGGAPGLIDGVGVPADGILTTDAEGIAVCSLQTDINSGINNVEATIDDGNPPSEELVTFSVETMAGNISYYTVVPDGLLKTAGETFDVTITAYDPFDNVAFGDDTTEVQLASDGAAEFSLNPVTLSNGSAIVSVSDTVAQRLVVSAETVGGGALSYSDTVTVVSEVPYGSIGIASVNPPTITATGTSISTITTQTITDRYGNVVSSGTKITVSTDLGEVLSEDVDPITPGRQRETGVNGIISVFIRSADTPGIATITLESVEGSALGTAALVYAAEPDCGYAGFLDPRFVVPDSTATFRCSVENYSTTGLTLSTMSTISFSDSLGNTYSAALPALASIGGSSTVTLEFAEAIVPGSMLGGTYTPSVFLYGLDEYNSIYSVR